MAAIRPHLALDDENSDQQNAYWRCTSEGALGDSEDDVCPSPMEIANEAHAELMNTAWIREALIERMKGKQIWIEYEKGVPTIAISRPVPGPAWNPSGGAKRTTILGWTTKMGAPSFSLPAGAPAMGGACPGASAGQTIAPPKTRLNQAKLLLPVLNNHRGDNPRVDKVDVTKTICEFCYAEGGQYSTSGVQNAQLMRYAWAKRAIQRPGTKPGVSEFYSVMIDAIENADFKYGQEPQQYKSKNQRFFRIHDSGDFFSVEYFKEWKKITLYYHPEFGGDDLEFEESKDDIVIARPGSGHPNPIYFWAPTRMWAVGEAMVKRMSAINGLRINGRITSENFSVRPSAYHINQHGPFFPEMPGWAAPTTVYDHDAKMDAEGVAYDWDCRAYAVEKGPSCRGAEDVDGREGCRACWLHTDKAVNYTLHL